MIKATRSKVKKKSTPFHELCNTENNSLRCITERFPKLSTISIKGKTREFFEFEMILSHACWFMRRPPQSAFGQIFHSLPIISSFEFQIRDGIGCFTNVNRAKEAVIKIGGSECPTLSGKVKGKGTHVSYVDENSRC